MDNNDIDILETFKAAALSVTRLYKTSAAAATKARSEGYKECLEDLVSYLDKNKPNPADRQAVIITATIRQWALERHDGRELTHNNTTDSDDDVDKPAAHPSSSPVAITRVPPASLPHQNQNSLHTTASSASSTSSTSSDIHMQTTDSLPVSGRTRPPTTPVQAPPVSGALPPFREPVAVPASDTFTFQSTVPYPQAPQPADNNNSNYPNLANLELSDSQHQNGRTTSPVVLKGRIRSSNDHRSRTSGRGGTHVSRLAGQKRRLDFNELFDLQSIGKDGFPGGKRARHN